MLELLLWSTLMAVAPLTPELTRRLVSAAASLVGPAAETGVVATDPGGAADRAARRTAAVAAKEGVPCPRSG